MAFQNLRLEREGGLALLTVHRPDKLNALNDATLEELRQAFADLERDEGVRCVILTGAEAKRPAFVAGADIAELAEQDAMTGKARSLRGQAVCDKIERFPRPVIAAINGYALGGGLELALACHIRLASEEAKLGLPEVTLGIIPGFGGTQRLPRLIGLGAALELIVSGRQVDAQEALRVGLVNHVYPAAELLPAAKRLGEKIGKCGPVAVRLALESVFRGRSQSLPNALGHEANLFGLISTTQDMREGLKAFLEKRAADFRNE